MSKKMKFALTTLWIIFSRSYDAYCTSLYTPDLELEANPLVSVFGMGWTPLLITVSILTVFAIYAHYVSLFNNFDLQPSEKGYSLSHFIGFMYLGSKQNWYAIIYKIPKSLKRFTHYMGNLMSKSLVFAGIVSTLMWLLLNNNKTYQNFHSPSLIYTTLIIGCIIIIFRWNKKEYSKYLNN